MKYKLNVKFKRRFNIKINLNRKLIIYKLLLKYIMNEEVNLYMNEIKERLIKDIDNLILWFLLMKL